MEEEDHFEISILCGRIWYIEYQLNNENRFKFSFSKKKKM